SSVLRRGQTVERVVGKGLVARVVAVVEDGVHIAVVAVAQVEVITDGEHGLARRGGRHEHRLQALVVAGGVRYCAAAGEVGQGEVGTVAGDGDEVNTVEGILCVGRQTNRVRSIVPWRVSDRCAAGVG